MKQKSNKINGAGLVAMSYDMKKVLTLAVVLAATLALSSCGTTEKCPTYSHVELPSQHG